MDPCLVVTLVFHTMSRVFDLHSKQLAKANIDATL